MPARLRRRLRAWRTRVRRSVGYWWLEQRELSGGRRRPWRRPRLLLRQARTWTGDRWYDVTDGVRRGGRRLRRGPARAWRALTRPLRRRSSRAGRGPLALARRGGHRLAAATVAAARSVVATPASGVEWVGARLANVAGVTRTGAARGGRGLQGRLARASGAVRTRSSRGRRSLGAAVATAVGSLATVGTTTSRAVVATPASGVEWLGDRLARATSAARAGTSRRGHSVGAALAAATSGLASAATTTARAVLATPAAGVGWLGTSGRRLAVAPAGRWLAAGAALVVVGGVVVVVLPDSGGRPDPAGRSGAARADSPARDAVAGSGPGFTRPGINLSVSPEESGELGVVERVETRHPVRVLPLAAPPPGTDTGAPTSRLVGMSVVADGVSVPLDGLEEIAQEERVRLPRAASSFELRYRVVGAEERSPLAPPGRATLSLRPAASALAPSTPAVVEVRDAVVHTLVCLDAPRSQQLCGVDDDDDGWHTEQVTAATSRVLALVDLPSA